MADALPRSVSALDGVATPGRHGLATGDAGVVVRELRAPGLATVTARKDRQPALLEAARAAFGIELPASPRRVAGRDIAFVWSGPGQWLACREATPAAGMEALLAPLAAHAALVDQSHGRVLLRLSGPRLRDAMAKGFMLDLDPGVFKPGDVAVTSVHHVGVHLWQVDEAPTFEVSVLRSYAGNFWHWLEASAAEYGLDVAGPAG